MSYAFDTAARAWAALRAQLPEEQRSGELAYRFEMLLEEMHEANHRQQDAINKDAGVTAKAHRLDKVLGSTK